MTRTTSDRRIILTALIELSLPLPNLASALKSLPWDFDGEEVEVEVERKHFAHVLNRYLTGSLSSDDLELWANLVEGREDLCFGTKDKAVLADILHELANPLLTQRIDRPRASALLCVVGRAP